jgi:coproporphyrinogen III oxidase
MMMRPGACLFVVLLCGCASTSSTPRCGGTEPLGCSIPAAVLVVSKDYEEQADKFHNACVTHDLCYRHGAATYGLSRKQCDDEFYDNMKAACSGFKGLGVLDPEDFAKCQFAAKQTFEAVRTHGEKHFQATTSTYCAYR